MLDRGTDRMFLKEVMDSYGEEGEQILGQIAADEKQSPWRRGQAIRFLGELRLDTGKKLSPGLLNDQTAVCAAISAIPEYRDPALVPRLIPLLDNGNSCPTLVPFTVPDNRIDQLSPVLVSDETVDALERITGQHLKDQNETSLLGHRATQPWKDWWNKNRTAFIANPFSFIMGPERRDESQDEHYSCSVYRIAVSPDGKTAFSSGMSYDPWVRAWDINTRQQIWATAKARDEDANAAAFSPSGRMVAVGFTQGTVMVFDAATGRRLHMLVLGGGVDSVAFNPDGTLLAAGLDIGGIRLFDTKSWCETKQIDKAAELIEGIAFSPDGSLLAAATFEKVLLWSVADAKQVRTFEVLPGQPPKIFADEMEREARLWRMAWRVAFSPDGKLLATGSNGAVQLWDLASGRAIKSTSSGGVGSLYFSPDGQWIVWGNGQNEIVKWNPRTGKRLRIEDEFSLGDTAITPDGNLILSPGVRTDIAMYDFQSRRKVGVLTCTNQRH